MRRFARVVSPYQIAGASINSMHVTVSRDEVHHAARNHRTIRRVTARVVSPYQTTGASIKSVQKTTTYRAEVHHAARNHRGTHRVIHPATTIRESSIRCVVLPYRIASASINSVQKTNVRAEVHYAIGFHWVICTRTVVVIP